MAYSSSIGDVSLVEDVSVNGDSPFPVRRAINDPNEHIIEKNTVEELADTLLKGKFFLTALEFYAELQDAGLDLPKLRQFFSNPANVEQRGKVERPLCRSPSQQTIDSIEFDRVSEVNNTEQDRVAVLEYELRKAKETIKRLRENVTEVQVTSSSEKPNSPSIEKKEIFEGEDTNLSTKPIELLEKQENTDQDFDDWDDVGVNISRPPSLIQLYRRFLHYRAIPIKSPTPVATENASTNTSDEFAMKPSESEEKFNNQSLELKIEELEDNLRKAKHNSEREINRLMFENERINDELKKLTKTLASSLTGGVGGPLANDISAYSIASTVGPGDEDQVAPKSGPGATCLKVKSEPCEHIPPTLATKILEYVEPRPYGTPANSLGVFKELDNLKSSFSPYDCTLSWEFYKDVKKVIPEEQVEEVVPLLVWLMLRTNGDQREEITQELISLFGNQCELKHIRIVIAALLCYAELANIQEVQSHLLAVCWEQINNRDKSRRLLVAVLCGPLACFLEPQIRSSLLFSILSQLLEEDRDAIVRLAALDSLVQVVMYLEDYEKLNHLIELYVSIVCKDSNEKMVQRTQSLYLPVLLLWANQNLNAFVQIIKTIQKQIDEACGDSFPVGSSKPFHQSLISLHHALPVIIYYCAADMPTSSQANDSWHADPVKLPRIENELFDWPTLESDKTKLRSLLENLDLYVTECIGNAALENVENAVEALSALNLSQPLACVCNDLFPLVVKLSTTISYEARSELESLIQITCFMAESLGPTVCTKLMAPLFIEQCHGEKLGTLLVKPDNSLRKTGFVAVYCAFLGSCPTSLKDEIAPLLLDCIVSLSTSRCDLAPVSTAFSMLAPLPQLQLLLSVVWDCVVHPLPNVRSSAAYLAEHLISLVDTSVLSSRLFSALVTLSNDPQLSVRLATLGPLVALLTQTDNAQLLEKVYFQLQQVLDDPQCASDTGAHLRTVELFTRIIPNVDAKFRDEFILQRFAVMAAQNNHCQDREARQSIAEALLNAYHTANCCYIPESSVRRLIIPALKCLAADFQQLGLKANEDGLAVLTKEVERKLGSGGNRDSNSSSSTLPHNSVGSTSLSVTQLSLSTSKERASSVNSGGSAHSATPSIASNPPALGSIITSQSAAAAAEAAKSKFAKFREQSKNLFHK